jgi:hypothetical protein
MAGTRKIDRLRGVWNEQLRTCDHVDCDCIGEHRAPKSRDRLRDYYWFCLAHVREYNRAWNFYAGMNPHEIESEVRHDTVWQRPSWPLGARTENAMRFDYQMSGLNDQFGFISDSPQTDTGKNSNGHRFPEYTLEGGALGAMDLEMPLTLTSLKTRYKELVKRLHPDVNGGDTAAEERLKEINDAYETLKKAISS